MDLRRRILDATRILLVERGYEALSMRGIARRVGVSATSLYLHFASKDALFQALVAEGMERLYSTLRRAVEGATDDSRIEELCRAYIDFGLTNPEYYELMFVIRPRTMHRFPAEDYRRARRNLDLLASALTSASPGSDDHEARLMATTMWAALHGVVTLVNAQRVDRAVDAKALLDTAVRLVDPRRGPLMADSTLRTSSGESHPLMRYE